MRQAAMDSRRPQSRREAMTGSRRALQQASNRQLHTQPNPYDRALTQPPDEAGVPPYRQRAVSLDLPPATAPYGHAERTTEHRQNGAASGQAPR